MTIQKGVDMSTIKINIPKKYMPILEAYTDIFGAPRSIAVSNNTVFIQVSVGFGPTIREIASMYIEFTEDELKP